MEEKCMTEQQIQKKYQAASNYIHRAIAGSDVLISVGANIANFNGYISLNPTAAFLWDAMKEPKTMTELVQALQTEFEVDSATAVDDTQEFINDMPYLFVKSSVALNLS